MSSNVSILPLSSVKKKSSKIKATEISDFFYNFKWQLWILRGISEEIAPKQSWPTIIQKKVLCDSDLIDKHFQKLYQFL